MSNQHPTRSSRSPIKVGINQTNEYFRSRSNSGAQGQLRQAARGAPHARSASIDAHAPGPLPSLSIPPNMQNTTSYDSQQQRPGRRSTLVGQKIEDISNMISPNSGSEELPMYKDKPYNYSASQRRLPIYRRTRVILFVLVVLVLGFFFTGASKGKIPAPPLPNDVIDTVKSKSGAFRNLFGSESNVVGPSSPTPQRLPDVDWDDRRARVRDAFKLSWESYEANGWGYDEYHPFSKTGRQMVPNGMGWIIIDALDTMMIMNLTTELAHAREWISTSLSYDQDHDVSTFETTIRMLGGLLSAHYLSNTFPNMAPVPPVKTAQSEDMYLELAVDLAERLLGAYNSKTGLPYASVNLKTRRGIPSHEDGGASSTAEAGSLSLEMKYLANLTGERNYWDSVEKIMQIMDDNGRQDGLLPIYIYADTGKFRGDNIRLGSRGDSYYEYLIKQYLQTSEQEPIYLELWDQALWGIRQHLVTFTKFAGLTILGERPQGLENGIFPKMDHLVCFMPGTIALSATRGKTLAEARKSSFWSQQKEDEMQLARSLMKTCWGMYLVTATGLSPEIAHFRLPDPVVMAWDAGSSGSPKAPEKLSNKGDTRWRMDYDIHVQDFHNLQRPEFVESLFYMWRITGEKQYREWGWDIFQSFVQYTAVPDGGGFSSVNNVDKIPPPTRDNMESFWLAETLKYLYLLFGPDDLLPIDEVVFNTEAHPMPRFPLSKVLNTGWKRKPRDASGNIIT